MEWKFLDYPLTQRYPATPIKPINLLEPGGGGRKRRNSSSKAAVGRVRGNRCFGVSRPISPKWNERGWAIVEADPRRVYIYIYLSTVPLFSPMRFYARLLFFCPSPKLPEIQTGPVLAHARARARLLTAAVHDGVSEGPAFSQGPPPNTSVPYWTRGP